MRRIIFSFVFFEVVSLAKCFLMTELIARAKKSFGK